MKTSKKKSIAIKPYVQPGKQNMGLENYEQVLFEGVAHIEQLACIEKNGVIQYVTGLNEFDPKFNLMSQSEKEAKIKEIRTIVSEIEKELASNIIDVEDKDFWSKVQLLKPNNESFWNTISLTLTNGPKYLNLLDPIDRIIFHAIEAGGFTLVAKSYEDARSKPVPPKFYLDKVEETAVYKTEYKKLRNKAFKELQELYDKNPTKLFYVAKIVDLNSAQYKKSTPNDVIYDNMDNYIMGIGTEKNKERAAKSFSEASALDIETLKIKSIVKDSIFFKYLITKADGHIYHATSNTIVGRNLLDCVEFMKNPLHEDILMDLTTKVESFWNN